MGGFMDNIINRKPLLEDAFVASESKLVKALDGKTDQPRFLVIHLTNKVASARKEIKSYLTLKETKVLSIDLLKESSVSFDKEIKSFISEKASIRNEESRMENPQKKVVLLSGLNTVTQNMISDTLLSQWNVMSDENCRFIMLVASESTARDLHLKLKASKVEAESLDIRDFSDRVKSHLGSYKKNVLNIHDKGKYLHNGKTHYFDYILPIGLEMKNILPYNNHKAEKVLDGIDLHRYHYHPNSSQIMCINFFYPLKEKPLNHILRILDIDDEVDYSEFEKASDVEGANYRKTMFDFYIRTKGGKNVFFEIKYTEDGFGKAEDDEDHQRKFTDVYEPKLNQSEVINKEFKIKESFFENYQIIRNVININEDSYVVFIYPEENIRIRSGAKMARDLIISSKWQNHFKPITWEAITEEILYYVKDDKELKEYYLNRFSRKYML